MKKLLSISLAVALLASLITGGLTFSGCAKGEAITDVIKIDSGYISGTVIGDTDSEVHIYRGVPYAAPPVGELRWKAPQPVTPWSGILECTDYCSAPPQDGGPYPNIEQSEDCLYVNVVTPAENSSEKLPVIVYFHGGALSYCDANDDLWNNYRLPSNGLVFVSVSHRLGTMGLLADPLLDAESTNGVSGNYLFQDLIASLKWVQENIAAFGGDPDDVTIMGGSGGGWKVETMMASPLAKGLFDKAVIQSGGGFEGTPLADLETIGEALFDRLGVTTLEEARALPWEDIVNAFLALQTEQGVSWDAAIDGWLLPDKATNLFDSGNFNAVPLMAGCNLGELPTIGLMMNDMPYYVDLFNDENAAGVDCYAYLFDQVPAGWRALGGVSSHATDLFYFFGDYDHSSRDSWPLAWWMQSADVQAKDPEAYLHPGLDATDKKVSEEIMAMVAQFCATGDPSVDGLPEWPTWEASSDQYMYLSEQMEVRTGFSHLMDDILASQ